MNRGGYKQVPRVRRDGARARGKVTFGSGDAGRPDALAELAVKLRAVTAEHARRRRSR